MQTTQRIASVDIVRGAVMIFMALDHVRDFVSIDRFPPEDLSRASAALFATRWITHFCAPAFFLLAGVGIGILLNRGKRPSELSRYLLTRGLWLLLLELVITGDRRTAVVLHVPAPRAAQEYPQRLVAPLPIKSRLRSSWSLLGSWTRCRKRGAGSDFSAEAPIGAPNLEEKHEVYADDACAARHG